MTTLVALRRRIAAELSPDAWGDLLVGLLTRTSRLAPTREIALRASRHLTEGRTGSAIYGLGWLASRLERGDRREEAFLARLAADVLEDRAVRRGYRRHRDLPVELRRVLLDRLPDLPPARPGRKKD